MFGSVINAVCVGSLAVSAARDDSEKEARSYKESGAPSDSGGDTPARLRLRS